MLKEALFILLFLFSLLLLSLLSLTEDFFCIKLKLCTVIPVLNAKFHDMMNVHCDISMATQRAPSHLYPKGKIRVLHRYSIFHDFTSLIVVHLVMSQVL